MSVVGGVFDKGSHNKSFVGPVPFIGAIEGVPDVDAVVEGVLGVVVNEPWRQARRLVFFIGLFRVLIVNLRVFVVVVLSHGQHAAT